MSHTAFALAISAVMCLAGCAPTASVRTSQVGATTAHTKSLVVLTDRDMTGGRTAGQRVLMEASAACAGHDCSPDVVELSFINGSDFTLDIDPR